MTTIFLCALCGKLIFMEYVNLALWLVDLLARFKLVLVAC